MANIREKMEQAGTFWIITKDLESRRGENKFCIPSIPKRLLSRLAHKIGKIEADRWNDPQKNYPRISPNNKGNQSSSKSCPACLLIVISLGETMMVLSRPIFWMKADSQSFRRRGFFSRARRSTSAMSKEGWQVMWSTVPKAVAGFRSRQPLSCSETRTPTSRPLSPT